MGFTRIKGLFREIKLLVYYCSPCLLSLVIVIGANFLRVRDVENVVVRQVCQQLDRQNASNEREIPAQLQKIINVVKANGWSSCQQNTSSVAVNLTVPQYIRSYFLTAWSANSVVITVLTLLPFAILGMGLMLKYHYSQSYHPPSEALHDRLELDDKDQYLSYRTIAFKDFFVKFLVGFVITVGWLYIFNPNGQAASAINDWLRNTDIVASDTAPNFFNFKDSSLKHALAAVFGWYLYLLGYFSYRFYKSDVLGTRVYNVLFKKFLFVIGVAFIITSVGATSNESLLLIFLIGFFPLSALTLLTEFGSKRLSVGEDQTSLSILPGMSTWQILRLEEEGIDSLSSLANSDAASLNNVISSEVIGREILETWIDQARLVTVLGTKRWTDLNGICERASEFVRKESIKDPRFITKLADKNVFNADEISKTLQRNFKITSA
jgi:hypothetical protein